jgi:hypothetical protein
MPHLAVLILDVELSFLHVVGEQKRAYTPLGIGTVCLFDGTVGAIVARLKAHPAVFLALMGPGLVAFGEMILTEKQSVIWQQEEASMENATRQGQ